MGSSPEMERFGVSDADFAYMKDPFSTRFKQSKKERIYGIFASDDSDSDVERSGLGGRDTKLKRKGVNYSAPITFVSGGIKIGAADKTAGSTTTNKDLPISDDEIDELAVAPSKDSDSDSSPERNATNRKSFKAPLHSVGIGRRTAVAAAASKADTSGFGSWEKHTRGIGMKLLEQMGYQPGKGLGSEGQGITTPVQATQRVAAKAAVGYFGPEKTAQPVRGSEVTESTKPSGKSDGPRYKKHPGQLSKSKSHFKTAEDIIARVSPANSVATARRHGIFLENSEMSKVKVIDMTSKEQKVYSGYEAALLHPTRYAQKPNESSADGPDAQREQLAKRREGRLFDCPALRQNLSLILRSCEQDIRKLDRTARFEEDRCVALEHESEKLTELVKSESVDTKRLRVALDLIEKFEADVEHVTGGLSPEKITQWMTRIREECSDLPEMPVLMAAMARPMLDASLSKWKPLSDPGFCFQLMSKWQDLFQNTLAFDVVLESSWLTTLRRTIVNDWDPRECEPLLAVLEVWRCLLPEEMLEQRILNELVLPKLQNAVSSWNPLTDTIPIHTWLHPWLPWFGGAERLSAVHEMVLLKLGNCLTNWHPSDGSAHSILTPWRSVISVGSMSAFLNRNVVPKLNLVMQQFKLNPASQNMDAWNWVMRWADLVGPAIMANILEQHFWPRWLQVLSNWLEQGVEARQRGDHVAAGQVYQEVGRWYAGWKGQLPPECMEYAGVKDALTRALAMMERAMRGLPPEQPKPAAAPSVGRNLLPSSSFANSLVVAPPPTTLRKQVEQVAAQRGFAFYPVSGRTFEGQQVYCLERLHVFFDRNVSFVLNPTDGTWHPVSFAELMSKAEHLVL